MRRVIEQWRIDGDEDRGWPVGGLESCAPVLRAKKRNHLVTCFVNSHTYRSFRSLDPLRSTLLSLLRSLIQFMGSLSHFTVILINGNETVVVTKDTPLILGTVFEFGDVFCLMDFLSGFFI